MSQPQREIENATGSLVSRCWSTTCLGPIMGSPDERACYSATWPQARRSAQPLPSFQPSSQPHVLFRTEDGESNDKAVIAFPPCYSPVLLKVAL